MSGVRNFREKVDTTSTIRSILDGYPSNALLREILQNSDDACASAQTFILDNRSHPRENLLDPALSDAQGPALLCVNDTKFRDSDWLALQTIHGSNKRSEETKTGKYGLGFRSCYHVTDNPHILSGCELAVFDPHEEFQPGSEGGIMVRMDFADEDHYRDQLAAFRPMLKGHEFDGTIVRLPLRTQSQLEFRKIRKEPFTPNNIRELFQQFIEKDLDIVLLFLKHVAYIELKEIDEKGHEFLWGFVKVDNIDDVKEKRSFLRDIGDGHVTGEKFIDFDCSITASHSSFGTPHVPLNMHHSTSHWRICHSILDDNETARIVTKRLGVDVGHRLRDDKLISHVALAFPLSQTTSTQFKGKLFTLLPLPIETHFPLHAHATFSLTQDRQALKNQSERGTGKESRENLLVTWNELVFTEFFPRLWARLLIVLSSKDSISDIWSAWPPSSQILDPYWDGLPKALLQEIIVQNAFIFPIWSTCDHITIHDALITSFKENETFLEALVKTGVNVVKPPLHLYNLITSLTSPHKITLLSPSSVHYILSTHNMAKLNSDSLPRQTRLTILEYLTHDSRNMQEASPHLFDLPILPTTQDDVFVSLLPSRTPYHFIADECIAILFKHVDPNLIQVDSMPKPVQRLFCHGERVHLKSLSIAHFDSNCLARYLRLVGLGSITQNLDGCVLLAHSGLHISWFQLFWAWIGAQIHLHTTNISDLFLVPTNSGMLRKPSQGVLTRTVGDRLMTIMENIGIPFLSKSIPDGTLVSSMQGVRSAEDLHFVIQCIDVEKLRRLDKPNLLDIQKYFISQSGGTTIRQDIIPKFCSFPIFPTLRADPLSGAVHSVMDAVEESPIFINAPGCPVPIPTQGTTLLDVSLAEPAKNIARLIGYQPFLPWNVKDEIRLLEWSVQFLSRQPDVLLDTLLHRIIIRLFSISSATQNLLKQQHVFPVQNGGRRDSSMLIDPSESSELALLFEGEGDRLLDPLFADSPGLISLLRSNSFIQSSLTPSIIEERIQYISALHYALARRKAETLLKLLNTRWRDSYRATLQSCVSKWIPVDMNLIRPQDCRPRPRDRQRFLIDLTLPMIDIGDIKVWDNDLLKALGWDQRPSIGVLVEQFRKAVGKLSMEDPFNCNWQRLLELIKELAGRQLSESLLQTMSSFVADTAWIPISPRSRSLEFVSSQHVLLVSSSLDRIGNFRALSDSYSSEEVEFLIQLGCNKIVPVPLLLQTLDAITSSVTMISKTELQVRDAITILEELGQTPLNNEEIVQLSIPDAHGIFRPLDQIQYNDISSSPPSSQFHYTNGRISKELATKLHIPFASAVALDIIELDDDLDSMEMGEDLCTRIKGVLRDYSMDFSLNEFIANAVDAGATEFKVAFDQRVVGISAMRWPKNMQEVATTSAGTLLLFNNAKFTHKDYCGLRDIGKGGKSDHAGSIGRFGLGALTLFYYTELPMVISNGAVMILDPSGQYLPPRNGRKTTVWYRTIKDAARLGLLDRVEGMWKFSSHIGTYDGTIFVLPLRAPNEPDHLSPALTQEHRRKLLDIDGLWYQQAKNSMIFTRLHLIESMHVNSQGTNTSWSLNATATHVRKDSAFEGNILEIHSLDAHDRSRSDRSSWAVATHHIHRADIPPEHIEIMNRHKLLRGETIHLAIALPLNSVSRSSPKHLFSTLMLPQRLTLPVHVSAPLVLASDRRNVRFRSSLDSTNDAIEASYNTWILGIPTAQVYQWVLNHICLDHRNMKGFDYYPTWPARKDDSEDVYSTHIRVAFYQSLPECPYSLCVSATGDLVSPKEAIFPGNEPFAVSELLSHLPSKNYVTFSRTKDSHAVKRECIEAPLPHVDGEFVRQRLLEDQDSHAFLRLFGPREKGLPRKEGLQGTQWDVILSFLLDSGTMIHGLPLLFISNSKPPQCFGIYPKPVYYHSHDVSMFVPQDQTLCRSAYSTPTRDSLYTANVNVYALTAHIFATFLADALPNESKTFLSRAQMILVEQFWSQLQLLPDITSSMPFKRAPLFSSTIPNQFISLDYFESHGFFSNPRNVDSSLSVIFEHLGLTLVDDTTKYNNLLRTTGKHISIDTIVQKVEGSSLGNLSQDHQERIASWIRLQITSRRSREILLHLQDWPIWECRYGRSKIATLCTAGSLTMFSSSLSHYMESLLPYLRPFQAFSPYSRNLMILELPFTSGKRRGKPQFPISKIDSSSLLQSIVFPSSLLSEELPRYKSFIETLLTLYTHGELHVPNESLVIVPISTLYDTSIPLFHACLSQASLGQSQSPHFLAPFFRTDNFQNQLRRAGLHYRIDIASFRFCLSAIQGDIQAQRDVHPQAVIAFGVYSTDMPPQIMVDQNVWTQFDHYSFIPRSAERRRSGYGNASIEQYCLELPMVVRPDQLILSQYENICWSQRARFIEDDDALTNLLSVNTTIGRPTAPDVVQHLRTLALKVSKHHSGDRRFLQDIKETYQWLNRNIKDCVVILVRYKTEDLFLNIDDPNTPWTWRSAESLVFNLEYDVPMELLFTVRAWLAKFAPLLKACGAKTLDFNLASAFTSSPSRGTKPESHNLNFRLSEVQDMRREGQFVDIRFIPSRLEDGEDFGIPYGDWELGAHRLFLSASLGHFRDQFNSSMRDTYTGTIPFNGTKFEACSFVSFMYTSTFVVPDLSPFSELERARKSSILLEYLIGVEDGDSGLLCTADKWDVENLKDYIADRVMEKRLITPDTYKYVLSVATRFGGERLRGYCQDFIRKHPFLERIESQVDEFGED